MRGDWVPWGLQGSWGWTTSVDAGDGDGKKVLTQAPQKRLGLAPTWVFTDQDVFPGLGLNMDHGSPRKMDRISGSIFQRCPVVVGYGVSDPWGLSDTYNIGLDR